MNESDYTAKAANLFNLVTLVINYYKQIMNDIFYLASVTTDDYIYRR